MTHTQTAVKFDATQIESIINKIVPLLAAPKDYEFFKGVLRIRAEESASSADFSLFISKLLNQ